MALTTDIAYARPSDNIANLGTPSVSGLSAATPIGNAYDLDPGSAVVFTGASPWWIKWNFGALGASYAPIQWLVFSAFNYTAATGRTLRFQAHATDAFTTPTINYLVPALPVATASPFLQNFAVDLTGLAGISYLATHVWVRLLFTDSGGNPVPVFGDVFLAKTRRLLLNVENGVEYGSAYPKVQRPTPAGRKFSYSQGIRERWIEGGQQWSAAEWIDVELLYDDALGGVKPFPMQRVQTEEPMLVQFGRDSIHTRSYVGTRRRGRVRFEELVNDRVA
jgi:hypothetical protein